MHLEGMTDAKKAMCEDSSTLDTIESLLETMSVHDDLRTRVETIRQKVMESELDDSRASGAN
jgi:hypothetical protein